MLSRDLEGYIDGKRSLGFKFRSQAVQLRSFVAFAKERGDRYVRSARVLDWAGEAPSPEHRRNRLLTVRRFALAMHAENAHHEVPEAEALGRATTKRRSPYIYAPDEIVRLLRAAAALGPTGSIRPLLYTTPLGLIAATGMRIAEALALCLDDVTADGLVIRETKFQKSRLLPLHATVQQVLDRYLTARSEARGGGTLFVSASGQPLPYTSVRNVFLTLLDRTGLRRAHAGRDPRIHDLRHTFAVRSLEQCSHDRTAVVRHVVALSTYLGHAHVTDTYWYLRATPVLMGQIAEAGEALLVGGAATGTSIAVLKAHDDTVWQARFTPDGRRVVTVSSDGTGRAWDAATGWEAARLRAHEGAVNRAAFSPNGERVVTASSDHSARIWDARTRKEVGPLEGHAGAVNTASFGADGSKIVTASYDCTVQIWDAEGGRRGRDDGLALLGAGVRVLLVIDATGGKSGTGVSPMTVPDGHALFLGRDTSAGPAMKCEAPCD